MVINYPEPQFRIKTEEGREYIFDSFRKKWIVLTPEEWVRQNFICFLVQVKNYPPGLIAIEKEIVVGELKKRFDILVYNRQHQPWMMIECKAMEVVLDENVLQQLLRYNTGLPASYLLITNGTYCFGWKRSGQQLAALEEIPVYDC